MAVLADKCKDIRVTLVDINKKRIKDWRFQKEDSKEIAGRKKIGLKGRNKAGYTAQDAPSMRSFHLRK